MWMFDLLQRAMRIGACRVAELHIPKYSNGSHDIAPLWRTSAAEFCLHIRLVRFSDLFHTVRVHPPCG